MDPSTTVYSTITAAPSLHQGLLVKRAGSVTCGDLRSAYPNVQAPICAGQTSICTFTNGLQGCCDASSSCNFYTTCNGALAASQCTGSQCLACSQSAPYCVKYNFQGDNNQVFAGFSCDGLQLDSVTIFGLASAVPATPTSLSSSDKSTASNTNSSTISTSLTTSPSRTTSPSPTASPSTVAKSHTGAIAGGVVGGVLGGLALLAFGVYCVRKRHRNDRRRQELAEPVGEAQQTYHDQNMTSPHSYPY